MSGHSKWATIRRKKAVVDAKRGQAFTKHIRAITVAARAGGGDVDGNPTLRLAVSAAKAANMPNDTIDRAIKKGTGDLDGVEYVEISYEGFAVGGVAVMVDCLTDNRNRTVAEVRNIFTKCNGSLGESGSVAWGFDLKGAIEFAADAVTEEQLMEAALEAGAEDIQGSEGEGWQVLTPPDEIHAVRDALEAAGLEPEATDLQRIPKDTVALEGSEARQVLRLVDTLEEHDDVQKVWANYEISDAELERLDAEGS